LQLAISGRQDGKRFRTDAVRRAFGLAKTRLGNGDCRDAGLCKPGAQRNEVSRRALKTGDQQRPRERAGTIGDERQRLDGGALRATAVRPEMPRKAENTLGAWPGV